MADPKRVAERFLAAYSPPAALKFSPIMQYMVRPKSRKDLPTRERDPDDPHSHQVEDTESVLPDGEVQADNDPNDDTDRNTGVWPVKFSPNREKQRALPIPSSHPPKRDRSLIRPVFNVPDGQPGSRLRNKTITPIRTPGQPGEEYGTPTKYDYNTPTRRTMKAEEDEHQAMVVNPPSRALPKKRQKHQVGPARMYYRKRYRGRGKNLLKRRMKRRYRRLRRKPQFRRREKLRDKLPKRYKRRGIGYRQNKERARDWRKKKKREERQRGVSQRKEREKRQEKRRREREKRGAEDWRYPMMLGETPIEVIDFLPETGGIVVVLEGRSEATRYTLYIMDFLNQVNVYDEDDIDWFLGMVEHEFGDDVWEYLDPEFEDSFTLEDMWEDADDDLGEKQGDGAPYVTFHRVQEKPSNLNQNAPKKTKNKGTPRQDRQRKDYMWGPPSQGGNKGKEAPTSWVGPMTSQPGIQTPNKDHKHRGQPYSNPDLADRGQPQPAVEQQSGSAKVIPDIHRDTGNLSWRNKNKPWDDRGYKVAVELKGGTLLPVDLVGWDLEAQQVLAWDGKRMFSMPPNAVVRVGGFGSRQADTIPMIRRRAERVLFEKAKKRPASLVKFEKRRLTWTFKSGEWTVKLRALPEPGSKAVNVMAMNVRCACSCPFWRWQGPEHWGLEYDWQYGRPRGTASYPIIRDPTFRHPVCKHVIAVFDWVQKNKLKIPPESRKPKLARYLVDSSTNCEPDPLRLAERFLGQNR